MGGGDYVSRNFEILAAPNRAIRPGSFGRFPRIAASGRFSVDILGGSAGATHTSADRRLNYQARLAPRPPRHGGGWRKRQGRFTGASYLQFPKGSDAPRELFATSACSRRPAFDVIDLRLGAARYQFSHRPPIGVAGGRESRRIPESPTPRSIRPRANHPSIHVHRRAMIRRLESRPTALHHDL